VAANGDRSALDDLRAALPAGRAWTLLELLALECCVVDGVWHRTRDVPVEPAFGRSKHPRAA